jgi:hypothetical protein
VGDVPAAGVAVLATLANPVDVIAPPGVQPLTLVNAVVSVVLTKENVSAVPSGVKVARLSVQVNAYVEEGAPPPFPERPLAPAVITKVVKLDVAVVKSLVEPDVKALPSFVAVHVVAAVAAHTFPVSHVIVIV